MATMTMFCRILWIRSLCAARFDRLKQLGYLGFPRFPHWLSLVRKRARIVSTTVVREAKLLWRHGLCKQPCVRSNEGRGEQALLARDGV